MCTALAFKTTHISVQPPSSQSILPNASNYCFLCVLSGCAKQQAANIGLGLEAPARPKLFLEPFLGHKAHRVPVV